VVQAAEAGAAYRCTRGETCESLNAQPPTFLGSRMEMRGSCRGPLGRSSSSSSSATNRPLAGRKAASCAVVKENLPGVGDVRERAGAHLAVMPPTHRLNHGQTETPAMACSAHQPQVCPA